jgi:hypothetical protein
MRRALISLILVVLGLARADAQSSPTSPGPDGFQIFTYLDTVGGPVISRGAGKMVAQGWAFECRSGLQPVTQRIGSLAVAYSDGIRTVAPERFGVPVAIVRPDVARAYGAYCPAVGSVVGFAVMADPPPIGVWMVKIAWVTWDGSGRQTAPIEATLRVTVID